MRERRFVQCDVFSPTPTRGNGLAVVVDGDGLSDAEMQAFAAWTNLAETTFLSPPQDPRADYRVRIFTTVREMPFAGHPTLGSCAAWLHAGGKPRERDRVCQECAIGLVAIDVAEPTRFAFTAPPTEIRPLAGAELERIAAALEIPAAVIVAGAELDNGPVFQALQLADAGAVLALDASRMPRAPNAITRCACWRRRAACAKTRSPVR